MQNQVHFLPEWSTDILSDLLKEVDVRARDFKTLETYELPVLSLTKSDGLVAQSSRFKHRIALADVSNYKVVRKSEIVYNPYVIWEGAIHALRNFEDGLVSPAYPVYKVIASIADWIFIDEWLKTESAITQYNKFAAGAVNRRRAINKRDFENIKINLPSLLEQHYIAYVLTTVRQAIKAAEQVIEALRQFKKSMMKHLFTYGPVSVDQVDQVQLKETKIGQIPDHWILKECDSLCTQITVGIVVKPASHYVQHGVPAFRSLNVQEDRLVPNELVYFSPEENEGILSKTKLKKDDILVVRTGNPGVSCVVPEEYDGVNCIDLVIVRPNKTLICSSYLSRFFNSSQGKKQASISKVGLAQQHLNIASIKRTIVPVPPINEQEIIGDMLSKVDKKINIETNRKIGLEVLFQSLLHNLMTGKIRIENLAIVQE
jgi:type I restriction enzyme, S subunit